MDRHLTPALEEQGLTPLPFGSEAARDAAGRALARAMLRGERTPRQLTADIHRIFGHNLESTDELALLDDAYDNLEGTSTTAAELDAQVLTEARRLVS